MRTLINFAGEMTGKCRVWSEMRLCKTHSQTFKSLHYAPRHAAPCTVQRSARSRSAARAASEKNVTPPRRLMGARLKPRTRRHDNCKYPRRGVESAGS